MIIIVAMFHIAFLFGRNNSRTLIIQCKSRCELALCTSYGRADCVGERKQCSTKVVVA